MKETEGHKVWKSPQLTEELVTHFLTQIGHIHETLHAHLTKRRVVAGRILWPCLARSAVMGIATRVMGAATAMGRNTKVA